MRPWIPGRWGGVGPRLRRGPLVGNLGGGLGGGLAGGLGGGEVLGPRFTGENLGGNLVKKCFGGPDFKVKKL